LAYIAQRAGLLQNDAFLLFRALCKLSIRTLPEPDSDEVHAHTCGYITPPDDCFLLYVDWYMYVCMIDGCCGCFQYNMALRSKTLSLELLLSILENCGAAFRTARKFIDGVKEFLIMSLLENCVSPLEQIFSLSLSIFVSLMRQFKPHLKSEIGVFLDNIFLKVAENPNSTFGHKVQL
jgi:brefeldin A-inhibited guanine nucleotide-exchange protein